MSMHSWRPVGGPFEHPPMATVDFECYHCLKTTCFTVKQLHEREAEHWRRRYESLMGSLNDALMRCTSKHGDNPMDRDFAEMLIKIRDNLERGF